MSSVHFGRKPNRKRVRGSLNRTSENHYGSEPNRTGTGQNDAFSWASSTKIFSICALLCNNGGLMSVNDILDR